MLVRFPLLMLGFFLMTTPIFGQSKSKKPAKSKPITATVVVKGDSKPLPKENDESQWTEFESKEDGLTLLFPGRKDDVLDEVVGPVKTFDVSTAKAHYMLAIRNVGQPIDIREIDRYLEETIQSAFGAGKAKFLVKRNITYEGRLGKQIAFEDNGKRLSARLLFINGRLFITSVSMKSVDYGPEFDKWIDKFFDSFRVKVPAIET